MSKFIIGCFLFGLYSSFAFVPSIHEIELEKLFVIQDGFDSNDDIEVTLHMKLPNACYKVHNATIEKINTRTFNVKAYAKKKELSGCELGFYNTPVNVTQTLSIGELATGEYHFQYSSIKGDSIKIMRVKTANGQTIDDTVYAPISNAFIPELIYPTNNAQVVLTGVFHNSCMRLNRRNIKIIRENNIFIIIPKTEILDQERCINELSPIRQIISLGPIKEAGSYLIHVRSMSGLSVNKTFYVNKTPEVNRGNL